MQVELTNGFFRFLIVITGRISGMVNRKLIRENHATLAIILALPTAIGSPIPLKELISSCLDHNKVTLTLNFGHSVLHVSCVWAAKDGSQHALPQPVPVLQFHPDQKLSAEADYFKGLLLGPPFNIGRPES